MASKEPSPRRQEPAARGKKKKKPAAPRQPSGKLMRVGLIVFLSAWMFVLGILVGRGTAPVKFDIQKIEKELAELKAAALQKTQSQAQKTKPAAADPAAPKGLDQSLGFYETLKDRHTVLSFNAVAAANKQKPHTPALGQTPASGKKKTARPPQKPAAAPKSETARVKAPVKTAKSIQHPSATVRARTLTVQVASMKSQTTAIRLAARLKTMGYPAYMHIGKVPGRGIWYRVRVGRFSSRHRASRMQQKLKKAHFNAVIVDR